METNDPACGARPTRRCAHVCLTAATELVAGMRSEMHDEESVKAVAKGLEYASDAFGLAKALDSALVNVDDEMMHELLDWDLHLAHAHREAVEKWVVAGSIKPQRSVGDLVSIRQRGKTVVGEIAEIDERQATYQVRCESLGHVRDGVGTHGSIVAYEDVSDC